MSAMCRYFMSLLALVFAAGSLGCVPSNPTEDTPGAKTQQPQKRAKPKKKHTKPAATKKRPKTKPRSKPRPRPGPTITEVFEDDFERKTLGSNWYRLSNVWKIEDGQLCGQGARNKGIWLRRRLPVNARIEFEATSHSPDGDIKAEIWGDGMSGATSTSYTNATSYLTIFGGWKNRFHVLARLDEHDDDRLQIRVDESASSSRKQPAVPGRVYAFRVERNDGKTVSWWVDGHLMHRLEDEDPLVGKGHQHFGFNDWDVRVCFDNVRITPL